MYDFSSPVLDMSATICIGGTCRAFETRTEWANQNNWGGADWVWFHDFNGDGKVDLGYATANTSQVKVRLSTGSSFAPASEWANQNNWGGADWVWFHDFNGDGKVDLGYATANTSQVKVRLSTGSSFAPASEWANQNNWGGANWVWFHDFNGDGKVDFAYATAGTSQVKVRLSTGSSFAPAAEWANQNYWGGADWVWFRDFDGDGMVDLAYATAGTSQVKVRLSTGSSFAPASEWANQNYWGGANWVWFHDFSGDGRVDFAYATANSSQVMVGRTM
jgi:hypothetical protein